MAITIHEGIVTLFRECPDLVVKLAGPRLGFPAHARARVTSVDLGNLPPPDVIVEIADRDGALDSAVIVKVQTSPEMDREYSWPHYVTSLRVRRRCNASLVAVAINETMADWCAQPIADSTAGFRLVPVVIGPQVIPVVTEAEEAVAMPELGVLSVAAHGNEPGAERIALAALTGAARLDSPLAALYAEMIFMFLGDAARLALENLVQEDNA